MQKGLVTNAQRSVMRRPDSIMAKLELWMYADVTWCYGEKEGLHRPDPVILLDHTYTRKGYHYSTTCSPDNLYPNNSTELHLSTPPVFTVPHGMLLLLMVLHVK